MTKIKLAAIFSILSLIGLIVFNSEQFSASAKDDEILKEIAKYKGWNNLTKEPIKVVPGPEGIPKSTIELDLSGG